MIKIAESEFNNINYESFIERDDLLFIEKRWLFHLKDNTFLIVEKRKETLYRMQKYPIKLMNEAYNKFFLNY